MSASRAVFRLTVALSIVVGCADESRQATIAGDRDGVGDPSTSPGQSSAGAAAHTWCKQHEWNGYRVFDAVQSIWVGDETNIWISAKHLHTGFYGDDPKGQIGVQYEATFLLHWDGKDVCTAFLGNPVPAGFIGRPIGGIRPDDLWMGSYPKEPQLHDDQPIFHWDGSAWLRVPGVKMDAYQFVALGKGDVYATAPTLQHWDGVGWSEVITPALGDTWGFAIWPDAQGRIWTTQGGNKDNDCNVAVLSPSGTSWNGSCVLGKSAEPGATWGIAGLGDQPWVIEKRDIKAGNLGDRVLRLEGDAWTEVLNRGSSARCDDIYSAGKNIVCRSSLGDMMWIDGEGEPTMIKVPNGSALYAPPGRSDLWAITATRVLRSVDGVTWNEVVDLPSAP